MIDCTVREYAERDRAEVVALWNRVFADDPPRNAPERVIERKLGTQRELFLVAHVDGQVVGTVLGGYDGFRGWVYHLAVASEHRRAGIGRALMQQIEGRLRALGCPKINLQIRTGNAEALAFYARLGFTPDDVVSVGKRFGRDD